MAKKLYLSCKWGKSGIAMLLVGCCTKPIVQLAKPSSYTKVGDQQQYVLTLPTIYCDDMSYVIRSDRPGQEANIATPSPIEQAV